MIKHRLRILMAENGIFTIKEIEERTGISRQTLDKLDKYKAVRFNFDTIEKLCKFFNCEIHDLLYIASDK